MAVDAPLGWLTSDPLAQADVYRMIRRRANGVLSSPLSV